MLAVKTYDQDYIDGCRAQMEEQLAAYDGLVAAIGTSGRSAMDKTIKYTPDGSVLGLAVGDEIRLDEEGFRRLCDAYFAELEQRFT